MEAVKQGTPVLGLRSKTHVVLVSFKRAQSELANHQQKIFKIDDHMAIGISGLTADARVLADYMRNECLNHRYVFDSAMNVGRLVAQVADKSQQKTQNSSKRPYGVGLLVAGCDEKGPHLYETCPSGNYFDDLFIRHGEAPNTSNTSNTSIGFVEPPPSGSVPIPAASQFRGSQGWTATHSHSHSGQRDCSAQ